MKKISIQNILTFVFLISFILIIYFLWNTDGQIRLIIRGNNMGFSHYTNVGCSKAYQEGILTAMEMMVPGDYFTEVVKLLKNNSGLYIGIHLTLNSE